MDGGPGPSVLAERARIFICNGASQTPLSGHPHSWEGIFRVAVASINARGPGMLTLLPCKE